MEQTENISALFREAGEFIETKVQLYKLKTIDKASDAASSMISRVAGLIFLTFFVLLLSIGLALFLGEQLGKTWLGFVIVAGVYGLAGLIIHAGRKKMIKDPVAHMMLRKFFN
jgi:Putative Actinobacterial Holin-X, holin superfamily III